MTGEIVLVIGGSKGIGEAIVKKAAGKDRTIIYTYFKSEENARKISDELTLAGLAHYYYRLNITDPDNVTQVVDEIGSRFGRIDVLINNAGIVKDDILYSINNDDWFDVINTNLSGVFFVCRAVSKYMIRQRQGKIVNISSIVVSKGSRGQASYCASKGGVEALTKSLAVELSKKNITANCVSPGIIETDMTRDLIDRYRDLITQNILLKRIGKPEDIAEVVSFLISPSAGYINGQIIHVDGGML